MMFYEGGEQLELFPIAPEADVLWDELRRLQGEVFRTVKGIEFTYEIRGYELFVNRKDKSITRSTVNLTYRKAMDLLRAGEVVDGPKKLGTFGASYLFPIFVRMGVIPPLDEQLRIPLRSFFRKSSDCIQCESTLISYNGIIPKRERMMKMVGMKKGFALICVLMAVLMALPALAQSTGVQVDGETYVITGGDGTYEVNGKTFVIEGNTVTVRREGQEDLHLELEAAEETDVVAADAAESVTVFAASEVEAGTAVYTFSTDEGDVLVHVAEPGEISYTVVEDTAGRYAAEFSAYAKYGLSYDAVNDLLYYQGKLVRIFEDTYKLPDGNEASINLYNGEGEVDVRAQRDELGELMTLEMLSSDEFIARDLTAWTEPAATFVQMTATDGEEPTPEERAAFFAPYAAFGLNYDAERDLLFYEGKQVHKLVDYRETNGEEPGSGNFSGVLTQIIYEGGEVDVTTVRDYDHPDEQGEGKLIGLNVEEAK